MRVPLVAVLAIVAPLAASSVPAAAQSRPSSATIISGTVVPADGGHFALAEVLLLRPLSTHPLAMSRVAPDGRFVVAAPDSGPLAVEFTAVDHYSKTVTFLLEHPSAVRLDVRLKHYTYTDSLDRVTAIGDFNGWQLMAGRPLVKQPDGTYTLDVETTADSLAYQLMGLEVSGNRSINGTSADHYVYDNGGDYRSVIKPKNGHATIVLDPTLLGRDTTPGDVSFRDPTSMPAQLYAAVDTLNEERSMWFDSARAARARKASSVGFDWSPILARRTRRFAAATDPWLRQLYALELLDAMTMGAKIDSALAHRLTAAIPPTSPLWDLPIVMPSAIASAFRLAAGDSTYAVAMNDTAVTRATLDYLDQVVAAGHNPNVAGETLVSEIYTAKRAHDEKRANQYYTKLTTDYPNSAIASVVKAQFSPHRMIQVGKKMPAFSFAKLGDSSVTYTNASMKGKVYLLDFWATWCGPCVGELPTIQAAYDSLHTKGLEILSVSLDASPKDVTKFMKDKEHKMPWMQAYVSGEFDNAETKRLEVFFLPREVLIGKDGTILAADDNLRGKDLMPAVTNALGMNGTP